MTNPRILILSTAYFPLVGGSELAIRHVTDQLTGYDFDLVTGRYRPQDLPREQVGRVRVFRAGGRWARWPALVPKALLPLAIAVTSLRLMRTHQYALIHAYQASQAAGAAWLLKLFHPRIPLIITLQEGESLEGQTWLLRFFRSLIMRSADRVIAISASLAQYARRMVHVPVEVIPNGVDVQRFSPAAAHAPGHTIISVSRLVPKNGIAQLIAALPQVLRQVPDTRLVLIGDGPERARLQQMARKLGVAHAVMFVGTVLHDELPQWLHRADVFVRPSLSEGLGSAFLEAMAAGVVIVGSLRGGIADFLTDGQTGLVCDPESPESIAAAIVRGLTDTALAGHIRNAAEELVRTRFTWSIVAARIDEVYRHVIT